MNVNSILYLYSIFILLIPLQNISCLAAQNTWMIEGLGGDAYCLRMPLIIKQTGHENIKLAAQYGTNSFQRPIYYSVRISKWNDNSSWEMELIHLKIELINNPVDVQRFEISHGYNLLILNRGSYFKGYVYRLGGGIVIAHPENTIRGMALSESRGILKKGYYISGPVVQFGGGKILELANKIILSIEGKSTLAYGEVPIKAGIAQVPIWAFHILIGLGFKW